MQTNAPDLNHELASALRRRRAELRESMDELERRLAAPSPGNGAADWWEHVRAALAELSRGFQEHLEITEGPDGLYGELRTKAPRLSGPVDRLAAEHDAIGADLAALVSRVDQREGDVAEIREAGTLLLGRLVRHRQRGADLVYEAYEFDVGGQG